MQSDTLLKGLIIIPLIITALYYYYFREGNIFYTWLGIADHFNEKLAHPVINALPSFVHVYSFSLLTWLSFGKNRALTAIILWFLINLFFEVGQGLDVSYLNGLPSILKNYFTYGVFSWMDIIATLVASILAYLTIIFYHKKQIND